MSLEFFDREITKAACASGLIRQIDSSPYALHFLQSRILNPRTDDDYLTHALCYVTRRLVEQYSRDNNALEEQRQRISLEVSRAAIGHARVGVRTYLNNEEHTKFYGPHADLTKPRTEDGYESDFCDFVQSMRQGVSGSEGLEHLLSAAAYLGDMSVVERVLSQGANANKGSNIFGNPLTNAALKGHLDVVRLLVQSGADIQNGVPASPPQNVPKYYTAGADVFCYWYGELAHDKKIARTALEAAALGGHEDVVRFFLQPEFKVQRSGFGYLKAITTAAKGANPNTLKMMVEAADFSAVSEYHLQHFWNYTLTCAAVHGMAKNIPFLLEKGAQIESQHPFPRGYATPLGFAASRGHIDTVRLLLQEGADVDGGVIRPIQYAARYGFARTMELLLDQEASLTLNSSLRVLEDAAEYGRYNTAKVFLDRGLHLVPGRFDNGELALELAKVYGHEPVVRLLLEYGVPEED